jgi:hypothetical protein
VGLDTQYLETINLLPTNPEYWGFCFFTFFPASDVSPLHREYSMRIEALDCDVACLKDGTLLPLHDGDAMRGRFSEDNGI